ncbi:MAG: L,D-transpeptidase family protein [Oscillospiraceae bacterium]
MSKSIDLDQLRFSEDGSGAATGSASGEKAPAGKSDMARKIAESLADERPAQAASPVYRVSDFQKKTTAQTAYAARPASTPQRTAYRVKPAPTKQAPRRKKGAGKLVAGIIGGFLLVAVVGVYVTGYFMTKDKFLPDTTINGVAVGSKTLDEAISAVSEKTEAPADITFTKSDGSQIRLAAADIDYKLDTKAKLTELFNNQNHVLWFGSLFHGTSSTAEFTASYNKEKLKSLINTTDWGDKAPVDAYIKLTKDGYTIVDAVDGDKVDAAKLADYAITQLDNEIYTVDIAASGSGQAADIQTDDLEPQLKKLNAIYNLKIIYDFDYTTETLSGKTLMGMVTLTDTGYEVDKDKVMAYVETLSKKYDTYGTDRKFHSTSRGDITVPAGKGCYGWWIDQEKTRDALVALIEKGEDATVDPVYYKSAYSDFLYVGDEKTRTAESDIGDTYMEVDLKKQHGWYYVKGKLKWEFDVVSGLPTKERNTPGGVYKLWYKERGRYLTDDAKTYHTRVEYWNNISTFGIGFHDATWQYGHFGGDRYKTNGSHGCLNMSMDDAKYVWENIDIGTPVVMYW